MKKSPPLLIVIILFLINSGHTQESSSYEVYFETPSTAVKGAYLSDTFQIEHLQENLPFIGISAYCKDKFLTTNLFYRVTVEKQWSEWIAFREFTEGQLTDRVAYEAPPIMQKIEAIQFKSDQEISEKMTFRLYFPTPSKKKRATEVSFPPFNNFYPLQVNRGRTTTQQFLSASSETRADNNSTIQQLTCNCSQPTFCGRNYWCPSGNCPPDPTPVSTTPTHLIIHHSAGFNSSTNFPAVVAYYWDLHVNTNGWDDIGYNWLIDAEGTVYEGRGNNRLGAHFSCMNGATIGICMIGNFENIPPTETALAKLKEWLAWESCEKEIDLPKSSQHAPSQSNLRHVSGHRDGNTSAASSSCARGTVCPGDRLYEQLGAIAEEVAGYACLSTSPDLVILDMWIEPAEPLASDTIDLYVSLKNVGTAPAQGIRWDYRVGGETVSSDTLMTLAPDESQTRSFDNYIFPATGSYTYCIYADAVTDESNSANNSFCQNISVSGTTALSEADILDRFVIYPNPSSGLLNVEMVYKTAPDDYVLQLINPLGQTVHIQKATLFVRELNTTLDLRTLPPGHYYLKVHTTQGDVVRMVALTGGD